MTENNQTNNKPKTKSQILEEKQTNLEKEILELKNQLTTLTKPIAEKTLEEKHEHEHIKPEEKKEVPKEKATTVNALEHYLDCPTCHKLINEKAKPELFPEIEKFVNQVNRDSYKKMKEPVVCKDCGEIVERAEPKCKNCGSTEARKLY